MKMKNLLTAFSVIAICCACEKEIDPDIDTAASQVVIEAQLRKGDQAFNVLISRSTPYFESATQPMVENATVTLRDDLGNTTLLAHTAKGNYTAQVNGTVGTTYTLEVAVDGTTYTASSTMMEDVDIVNIEADFQEGGLVNDDGYEVFFRYNDPAGARNYYRAIYSINGVPQLSASNLQVLTDDFNNGQLARFPILGEVFEEGQRVTVEFIHFDNAAFDYFKSLADIVSDANGFVGGTAAPANPTTNWSGNVLGHFTAINSDTMSVVVR